MAATGAINASGFEYPYGFSLLDEAHNFFPELLYDETLFSNELITWMRYRVSTLFPSQYARNQNLYRMYQALSRQSSFRAWRSAHARSIASVTHVPSAAAAAHAPTVATTTWTTTPLRTNTISVPLPARTSPSADSVMDILNAFLTSDLLHMGTGMGVATAAQMRDVRVSATPAQINAASEIVASASIPEDQQCSICQDHGAPTDVWRVMGCTHAFHQPCVDRWFAQNVHCPICRTDIRTMHIEEEETTV
jgi:hypothetical protein